MICSFSAESEGFEPPNPLRSTVFKTAAINHSANSPMFWDCKDRYFYAFCKKNYRFYYPLQLFFFFCKELVLEQNKIERAHRHTTVCKVEYR